MNRRSFFTKLGLAAASVAILPAATTYARHWVKPSMASTLYVLNPEWVNAEYTLQYIWHPNGVTLLRDIHTSINFVPIEIQSPRYRLDAKGAYECVPKFTIA